MQGVGEIYEAYKREELESDDEVALIFNPYSFEPLSEPLVYIRHNLKIAVKEGVLDLESSQTLMQEAMSLYFPGRTYDRIINAGKGRVVRGAARSFQVVYRYRKKRSQKDDAKRTIMRARELADEV